MAKSDDRTVNLKELADILGVSTNTLGKVLERNKDFPVKTRGSNGIAYEFDARRAVAWWKENAAEAEAAELERQQQLDMWRRELFPDPDEETDVPLMKPSERKTLADAVRAEDYNRRQRGELLVRAEYESVLMNAVISARKDILQIPTEFARRVALPREQRILLEQIVTRRLNQLADRLGVIDEDVESTAA